MLADGEEGLGESVGTSPGKALQLPDISQEQVVAWTQEILELVALLKVRCERWHE
jgi:hypothetical protein